MTVMTLNLGQFRADCAPLYSGYYQVDFSGCEASIPAQSPVLGVLLTQIGDPRYCLRQPLLLAQETGEGGEKIVFDEAEIDLYGVGETTQEAVDEYVSMLVDLFEELVNSKNILSQHLSERLQILHLYLAPR